jgi:hypothetical protein
MLTAAVAALVQSSGTPAAGGEQPEPSIFSGPAQQAPQQPAPVHTPPDATEVIGESAPFYESDEPESSDDEAAEYLESMLAPLPAESESSDDESAGEDIGEAAEGLPEVDIEEFEEIRPACHVQTQ